MVESFTAFELSGAMPTPGTAGSFSSDFVSALLRGVQEAKRQIEKAAANNFRVVIMLQFEMCQNSDDLMQKIVPLTTLSHLAPGT